MANIMYIRVSSSSQSFDRQELLMKDLNIDRVYKEKISGRNMDRPELQNLLNYVREGDVVYVESLSRLGRSMEDLITIVNILNDKNVGLVSLKENYIDTTTPTGNLVFQIFGAISEFQRNVIKSAQAEGIQARRAKNLSMGRPVIMVEFDRNFRKHYFDWKAGEIKAVEFMKEFGLRKNAFYKNIKIFEKQEKI
ncbi:MULTISPECIES: recombinase family protein [unclassified Fusibacter]|uniref:recombinase family protein n=1 Tax=unclassified Fusibacter TaxID=2624464 RepID=UPI0010108DBC|nr:MULTISPECIES: recombinase family protein [unclassified Fusibacter]MCK8061615.1 recombinase family protein [Fusibacter sp. A2]NPE23798.1 recombinase family protein [Fusibacter sp. A1]RXV58635.1 recombinase family protein [Fusibacter sp. A1]